MDPEAFHRLVVDIARFTLRWSGEHEATRPSERRPG
jgi:hypothetical protein